MDFKEGKTQDQLLDQLVKMTEEELGRSLSRIFRSDVVIERRPKESPNWDANCDPQYARVKAAFEKAKTRLRAIYDLI